jgi:hypothetical protein
MWLRVFELHSREGMTEREKEKGEKSVRKAFSCFRSAHWPMVKGSTGASARHMRHRQPPPRRLSLLRLRDDDHDVHSDGGGGAFCRCWGLKKIKTYIITYQSRLLWVFEYLRLHADTTRIYRDVFPRFSVTSVTSKLSSILAYEIIMRGRFGY